MRQTVCVALLLASVACATTVEPTVRVYSNLENEGRPYRVFVTANDVRDEIERALRGAGIAVSEDLSDAHGVLRVKVGGRRAVLSGPCHYARNVGFELREAGRRVLTMKARGGVGGCEGRGILDEMSRELARMLPSDS